MPLPLIVALTIGELLISGASASAQHNAEKKAARTNREEALRAMREASKDISLLQMQQQDASALTIFEADRQARGNQALAQVSAGEAGVAGMSVEALMGDIDRKLGEFKVTERRNLDMALAQLQREKVSGRSVAQSRINAVQPPSSLALGLTLLGAGINAATRLTQIRPENA